MGFGQCIEPWNLESLLTFACAIVTEAAATPLGAL